MSKLLDLELECLAAVAMGYAKGGMKETTLGAVRHRIREAFSAFRAENENALVGELKRLQEMLK